MLLRLHEGLMYRMLISIMESNWSCRLLLLNISSENKHKTHKKIEQYVKATSSTQ